MSEYENEQLVEAEALENKEALSKWRIIMKKYGHWAFFPISIFYCELCLRFFNGKAFFNWGLLIVALFSVFFGLPLGPYSRISFVKMFLVVFLLSISVPFCGVC